MVKRTIEQQLEGRQLRRMKAEDRFLAKQDKKWAAAGKMIGELSSGKFYVFPVGGKYKEGMYGELALYLIRNHYV